MGVYSMTKAIEALAKTHEAPYEPQPKQPKYLYVYYRDKVYFLKDKDASNRYYIGKIEVKP